jgi:tryptophan 2,3-dioxygenase
VAAAWLSVYHSVDGNWDLYELAEKLVDLDHQFQLWRFSHMKTVERIIGYKRGTGGTGGVSYLNKALELRFFPELWSIRTCDVTAGIAAALSTPASRAAPARSRGRTAARARRL